MPHYVLKGLARFAPGIALKSSPSPAAYVAPNYGAKVQYETDDNSPPATPDEKVWVQQVNGYFLYYARVQNSLILPGYFSNTSQSNSKHSQSCVASAQLSF